jgi:dihydrofolate reductase
MKATVYIATSVDGFIARENGGIDWLPSGEGTDSGEDYGYQEFIDSVDALVMGRILMSRQCPSIHGLMVKSQYLF